MSSPAISTVRLSLGAGLLALGLPLDVNAGNETTSPKFEDYTVAVDPEALGDAPAIFPNLPPQARDELRARLLDGINFAGTATLAVWGCGAGCMSGGVFDARTGNWFELPFAIHRSVEAENDAATFAFRQDSRLLITQGLCNEQREGQFHFVWDGTQLVPLDAPALACWSD